MSIKVDENDPVGELEPSFPYRDVEIRRNVDMKEYYDLEGEIGRGKFGTVYRCREKSTGLTLAAKFVGISRREDRRNVEREVNIMRMLQHPRIIQLYDAIEASNVMCVVQEVIEGGELFDRVIGDDFILTEKSCTVFVRQICEGVAFIHSKNILHLDLKPENILCLTRTGNRIKIIDFGLARQYDPSKKLQVLFGTPEFVAPEVVNFDAIGFGTDMWSIGVICYVLLSGLSPFMGETDVETMANVTIGQYDFDDEAFDDISEEAKDFIQKLLTKTIEGRYSASECLSHPWLRRRPPLTANQGLGLDTTKGHLIETVDRWNSREPSPTQVVSVPVTPITPPTINMPMTPAVSVASLPTPATSPVEVASLPTSATSPVEMPAIPAVSAATVNPPATPEVLVSAVTKPAPPVVPASAVPNAPTLASKSPEKITIPEVSTINTQKPKSSVPSTSPTPALESVKIERAIVPTPTTPPPVDVSQKTESQSITLEKETNIVLPETNSKTSAKSASLGSKSVHKPETETTNSNDVKGTGSSDVKVSTLAWTKRTPAMKSQTSVPEGKFFSRGNLGNSSKSVESKFPSKYNLKPTSSFANSNTSRVQQGGMELSISKKALNPNPQPKIAGIVLGQTIPPGPENFEEKKPTNPKLDSSRVETKPKVIHHKIMVEGKDIPEKSSSERPKVAPPMPNSSVVHNHQRLDNPMLRTLQNDRFGRRCSDISCFLHDVENRTDEMTLMNEIKRLSSRLFESDLMDESNNNSSSSFFRQVANSGIGPRRPKLRVTNLNRDVPLGVPPPPTNMTYFIPPNPLSPDSYSSQTHSAPQTPRSSPEREGLSDSFAKDVILRLFDTMDSNSSVESISNFMRTSQTQKTTSVSSK